MRSPLWRLFDVGRLEVVGRVGDEHTRGHPGVVNELVGSARRGDHGVAGADGTHLVADDKLDGAFHDHDGLVGVVRVESSNGARLDDELTNGERVRSVLLRDQCAHAALVHRLGHRLGTVVYYRHGNSGA